MFFLIHCLEKWSFDFWIFAVSKFIFLLLLRSLNIIFPANACLRWKSSLPSSYLFFCCPARIRWRSLTSIVRNIWFSSRGDVISHGRLSDPTNTVLTALGLSDCENRVQYCINSVGDSSVTDNESKISALAEMWLFKAMRAQKDAQVLKDGRWNSEWAKTQRRTS